MTVSNVPIDAAAAASPGGAGHAKPAKGRSRLFAKYVALFVAVVAVALLANGVFDVFFYYREHKASLIRDPARAGRIRVRQDQPVHCGEAP
jgi:hypothetical protein